MAKQQISRAALSGAVKQILQDDHNLIAFIKQSLLPMIKKDTTDQEARLAKLRKAITNEMNDLDNTTRQMRYQKKELEELIVKAYRAKTRLEQQMHQMNRVKY